MKLAILGSTKGTDMEAIIAAIKDGILDASIEVVASDRKDAFILERAKRHGIPAFFLDPKGKTRETFDNDLKQLLQRFKPDVILLIGYMRILSVGFVREFKDKIINVHPSLLPAFAGGMDLNVHQAVLDAGVAKTGCTVHLVDEGVDTGKILLQKKCDVLQNDTAETLKQKVQQLEGETLIEVLRAWNKNNRNTV
ncbi:phosphoribosylglycinamide formyltransferase [Candidatus Uhrbacteria bacterium]|nr:phosphoribosylglycinamide formyltransferase [Candidatus Uhrbacteria bacterium]